MKQGDLLTLFVLGLLLVLLIGSFIFTKRSNYKFPFRLDNPNLPKWFPKNSEYQYDNPTPVGELLYYECIAGHCSGDTHDFDCLERCRIRSFLRKNKGGAMSPIKEALCSPYKDNQIAFEDCLVRWSQQRPH